MSQQVVLVTGAGSGFGYLAAKSLAEKGYKVYASMRNVDGKHAATANQLSQVSGYLSVVELDVTDAQQVDEVVQHIISNEGSIDVLINNAGVMNVGITEAYTEEQHYQQMDVNFFGPMRLFRAVLPHMRNAKSGLIITVTSLAGRLVFPAFTTYNSSKFAVEALAEGYRYELAPFGVDSIILEPGPFNTRLIDNSPKPGDANRVEAYGDHGQRLNKVLEGFEAFYQAEAEGLANPNIVVEDMVRLIELPFGARPMRTVSGVDYGTKELNSLVYPIQQKVLDAMDMTDLNPHEHTA